MPDITKGRGVRYITTEGEELAAIVTGIHEAPGVIDLTAFPPGQAPIPLTQVEQATTIEDAPGRWTPRPSED